MKEISSRNNTFIKLLKKQKEKNRFLLFLDNPKSIIETTNFGKTPKFVLIDSEKTKQFENLTNLTIETYIVPLVIIKQFTASKTPQGIIAVFDFTPKTLAVPKQNFLVLDSLQDAGNIGTLLRSALGANFCDVFLIDCVALTNEKIVKSSMATIFKLKVYETTKSEFVEFASENNLNLTYADMQGENIYKKTFNKPLGVIVGNEGNGVSLELKKLCKSAVSIPMENELESLNAGVAGSIIMYQINNKKE